MPVLYLDNRNVYVDGLSIPMIRQIARSTSYIQKGYRFVNAYKESNWDGRRKLVKSAGMTAIQGPAGLATEIAEIIEGRGGIVRVVDRRPKLRPEIKAKFDFEILRPYQREAVEMATTPHGPVGTIGRGILKLPTRSGKTVIAAAIIARLRARTLFVVPSKLLLYQTHRALESLLHCKVGMIGDGIWRPRDVTVASIQTMTARRARSKKSKNADRDYQTLLDAFECLIIDEFHHCMADEWRGAIANSDARYKLGLSATIFLDHDKEVELGAIWLTATTGPILLNVSVSELIEQGYLVRPEVKIIPIREPLLKGGWSASLFKAGISENPVRNERIVREAVDLSARDKRVVIITNRLDQVSILSEMITRAGAGMVTRSLVGSTNKEDRDLVLKSFKAGIIKIVISTVLDEGVDIPELDAVIVAEGGCDIKSTYQRLRCLTPSPGKERAYIVDFCDLTHPYFARHSQDRIQIYRSERAFKFKVVE